jgi:hypothetical protein
MQSRKLLTSDRIQGLVWFAFGAAVLYGSWVMDRLESLKIPAATAPGVPTGLLGVSFMAFALVLLFRREFKPDAAEAALQPAAESTHDTSFEWRRLALSWVLCMSYAGVLLGRGLPYWLLTTVFLFLHVLLLDETDHVPARPTLRRLILAAILAPAVAMTATFVFQRLFLVRLP